MYVNNQMYPALKISNLEKTYPHQNSPALQDISFEVYQGDKIGLIGANGSGKTTLFRLILNLLHPDHGTINILDQSDPEKAKKHLGFVSEHQEGLTNFTPDEILMYAGRMSGISEIIVNKKRSELLKWAKLESQRDELLESFSKGMRQRLFLASALIHSPDILLLDEPMSGLDPSSQNDFRELLKGLKSYTLLYASHQLADVEELCNRIFIFHQGKFIKDIAFTEQRDSIFILDTEVSIIPLIEKFKRIHFRESRKTREIFRVEILSDQNSFQKLLSECQQKNIPIHRIKSKSILEDEYDRYVKGV